MVHCGSLWCKSNYHCFAMDLPLFFKKRLFHNLNIIFKSYVNKVTISNICIWLIGIRLVLDWYGIGKRVEKRPKILWPKAENDPKFMLTRPKNIVDTLTVRT